MIPLSNVFHGRGAACCALFLGILILVALILSGLAPFDRTTWLLEVSPVLIALPVLALTHSRFPLTSLMYSLIFAHALVLILGGAYSYARVPLGFWIRDALSLDRNPYDKIGHFMQGFVPALLMRELVIRLGVVRGQRWVTAICVMAAMTLSALYELFEWGSAVVLGQGAEEFLGTQGDPWDTQSDMLCALIGACSALAFLSGMHDRQLGKMTGSIR